MSAGALSIRWPRLGSPRIRLAGRFEEPGRPTLVHCLRTMALHFYEYSGTLWLGGRRIQLKPGDVTITPARVRSAYVMPEPGFHICIHFEALPSRAAGMVLPLHVRPAALEHQAHEMVWHIVQLHHEGRDEAADGPARLAAQSALQAFLHWIALAHRRRHPARRAERKAGMDRVHRLRRILDARYREPWTTAQLAAAAGLSPGFLARSFKTRFGLPMQRYLNHRRIDCARHLLLTTAAPIKMIAYESGFANPQYFCRQFRHATGSTPAAFRAIQNGQTR